MRPVVLFCLFLSLLAFFPASGVHAQGPFVLAQPTWNNNGTGIITDPSLQNFLIDDDGDGLYEPGEGVHPIPLIVQNQIIGANYRLSPTRQYVYISGTASGGGGGAKVYFYRIPPVNGDPLVGVVLGTDFPYGIASEGFFDYLSIPGYPIAYVAGIGHPTTFEQEVLWVNLDTGSAAFTNNAVFNSSITRVTFEPSGIAAFVQHDDDGDGFSDYTVVELCDDDFGSGSGAAGGALSQVGAPALDAVSVDDGMGGLDIQVLQNTTVITQFSLDDCSVSPPVGACCLVDGSCTELTQSTCESVAVSGTWQGAGTTCAGTVCPPPPTVLLTLTNNGPPTGTVNTPFTYTLDYSNQGGLTATNSTVAAIVPAGASFVSAGQGGTFNGALNLISWTLGDIVPGASGSVDFTVDVQCGIPSVLFNSSWLGADQALVLGTPTITTSISSGPLDPLTVNTTSVADQGTPALNGDTITHTIELTNTLGETRDGVSFSASLGTWQLPVQVLNHGGGTAVLTANQVQWAGNIGPFDTATIQFQTQIDDCRSASTTETRLNNGFNFNVLGLCGDILATITPPPAIPLGAVPLEVTLGVNNVAMANVPAGGFWQPFALMRDGDDVEYELTITNNYATTLTGVTATATISSPLVPAMDPPFLGVVPPGFSYDSGTQTISFSGDVPGNTSLSARWLTTDPNSGVCNVFASASANWSGCANLVSSVAPTIWLIPTTPNYRHVLVNTPFSGLYASDQPASLISRFTCNSFEVHWGLGEGVNGDVWVSGVPVYRLNADALEMDLYDTAFWQNEGMNSPLDVAVANDGTVYFCGTNLAGGARIQSLDPTWQTTSIIYDEAAPSLGTLNSLVIDGDGFLMASAAGGILRVDPASPAGAQVYSNAGLMSLYGPLAVDTDGDVLACELTFSPTQSRRVVKVDRATGTHTLVVDLLGIIGLSSPPTGMTVDGDRVYFTAQVGAVQFIDRSTAPPTGGFVVGGSGQAADVEMVGTGPGSVGPNDPVALLPTEVEFPPNAPNPFNPATTFRFALPSAGRVTLELHDVRGRLVRTLVDDTRDAGLHEVTWQGRDQQGSVVASGVYFARLRAAGEERTQKIVLTK